MESAEWAGLESDRVSESSQSLRANKSLQSQYTQENPKVINGLHIIKDAFQHIRYFNTHNDKQPSALKSQQLSNNTRQFYDYSRFANERAKRVSSQTSA